MDDLNRPLPSDNIRVINPKNMMGDLGPICSYCSGLGFTVLITGGSAGCHRCDQTGIEPVSPFELQRQINELTVLVKQLLEAKKN